jgi:hypothetical protein
VSSSSSSSSAAPGAMRVPSPDLSKLDDSGDEASSPPPPDGEEITSDEAVRMITELLEGARKYRSSKDDGSEDSPSFSGNENKETSPLTTTTEEGKSPFSPNGTMPSSYANDDDEANDADNEKEIMLKPFSSISLIGGADLTEEMKEESSSSSSSSIMAESKEKEKKNHSNAEGDGMTSPNGSPSKEGDSEEEEPQETLLLSTKMSRRAFDDVKGTGSSTEEEERKGEEKGRSFSPPSEKKGGGNDSKEGGSKDWKTEALESVLLTEGVDDATAADDKSPIRSPSGKKEEGSGVKEDGLIGAMTTSGAAMSSSPASILSNGTLVCNLKDHRVLAGCTAVVALVVGNKLFVANAGDSRGVMMRGGNAVALSEDHKPTQERELSRIKAAGGYVNVVGRVNGNLNLSRSLGDLKYKQLKHLHPEDQVAYSFSLLSLFFLVFSAPFAFSLLPSF